MEEDSLNELQQQEAEQRAAGAGDEMDDDAGYGDEDQDGEE